MQDLSGNESVAATEMQAAAVGILSEDDTLLSLMITIGMYGRNVAGVGQFCNSFSDSAAAEITETSNVLIGLFTDPEGVAIGVENGTDFSRREGERLITNQRIGHLEGAGLFHLFCFLSDLFLGSEDMKYLETVGNYVLYDVTEDDTRELHTSVGNRYVRNSILIFYKKQRQEIGKELRSCETVAEAFDIIQNVFGRKPINEVLAEAKKIEKQRQAERARMQREADRAKRETEESFSFQSRKN